MDKYFYERAAEFAIKNINAEHSPMTGFLKGLEFMFQEMPYIDDLNKALIIMRVVETLKKSSCEGFWDSFDCLAELSFLPEESYWKYEEKSDEDKSYEDESYGYEPYEYDLGI